LIHLFTDFGWCGPYVGEMKAVLARDVPQARVIDLMHDAPSFNPKASGYLLAALSRRFSVGDICLAVVDPGVGNSKRRALILDVDGVNFVGPDNGLFTLLVRRAERVICSEILWRPTKLSDSFHGRDLFAPVASRVQAGIPVESRKIISASLVGAEYTDQLSEVIYIDHFGNAVTGLNADRYDEQTIFSMHGHRLQYARTFTCVENGQLFWYANSMGLIEIAANNANASKVLGLSVGSTLLLES
jgi:S-adenosylmethionine hydrolase